LAFKAALRTLGIRWVSGRWSSPKRSLAPAALKYLKENGLHGRGTQETIGRSHSAVNISHDELYLVSQLGGDMPVGLSHGFPILSLSNGGVKSARCQKCIVTAVCVEQRSILFSRGHDCLICAAHELCNENLGVLLGWSAVCVLDTLKEKSSVLTKNAVF